MSTVLPPDTRPIIGCPDNLSVQVSEKDISQAVNGTLAIPIYCRRAALTMAHGQINGTETICQRQQSGLCNSAETNLS